MNDQAAREVVLLQALETVRPACAIWTVDDAEWATRSARNELGAQADLGALLARRARYAMFRLEARDGAWRQVVNPVAWTGRWVVAATALAALAGGLADTIGADQRVNLLAPPLWGIVAWNLAVYAALLIHSVWPRPRDRHAAGPVRRALQRAINRLPRSGGSVLNAESADRDRVLRSFWAAWSRLAADLWAARAAWLLHAMAAGLALGLIGGLYLRGLALDYRAYWESTFLSAESVHAFLTVAFTPASIVCGIGIPDAHSLESLRSVHRSSVAGAPAAPWIHLLAATLVLAVVIPRTALAAWAGMQAKRREGERKLNLDEPYFQQLAARLADRPLRLVVVPYACDLPSDDVRQLCSALATILGPPWQVEVAPMVGYAREWAPDTDPFGVGDAALAVAWFDLAATPEQENHGRFAAALASSTRAIIAVDERSVARRFGSPSIRLEQRRAHWQSFAQDLGTTAVRVRHGPSGWEADGGELQRAMQGPIRSPVS